MSKQLKVAANLAQDLSEAEQAQARANIGAASASALSTLSSTVSSNSYEISGIKSKIAPTFGTGTAAYNVSGDTLISELTGCKLYCSISSTNYCQLKVTVDEGEIGADQSTIKSINGNFDGFRVYNYPWNTASSEMLTANIPYDSNNNGTIEIDLMTSDSKLIHLTIWYRADTTNSCYQFYVVEEVR